MGNTRKTWYVSHVTGNDFNACGSRVFPCKTLRHTVGLAGDGDSILLDGRGTEKHPYGCEKPTILPSQAPEFVNKSLTIIGLHQRAYLSCDHGLLFRAPASVKALSVYLGNLSFVETGTLFLGNCAVSVVNSTFSNCDSAVKIIGANTMLSLRMSVFTNNTNCLKLANPKTQKGDVIVDISDVSFKKNRIEDVLIYVSNPSGLTSVQVSNSLFEENHSSSKNPSNLVYVTTDERSLGELKIVHSSFISNYVNVGFYVRGCLNMNFRNLTFTTIYIALYLGPYLYDNSGEILITDSTFSNCSQSLLIYLDNVLKSNFSVQIRNTVYSSGDMQQAAISNSLKGYSPESHSSYQISLDNVTFHSLKDLALHLYFPSEGYIQISITHSLFLNNENTGGMIVYVELPPFFDCSKRTTWYKSHMHVTNTRFEENRGFSGIVFVRDGQNSFVNCVFTANYVLESTVGAVLYQGEGTGSLHVRNGTFLQRRPAERISHKKNTSSKFIYSEGKGVLIINNSTFTAVETHNFYPILNAIKGKLVTLDSSSLMKCPIGTTIRFINNSRAGILFAYENLCLQGGITFQVICDDCTSGTYTLERGHSTGLILSKQTCQPCPYGATCLDNLIQAKPKFWGYVSSKRPPILTFVPCPLGYCQPPSSDSQDYNGCYGHRTGVMCGGCTSGYSEELFTTKCREKCKCQNNWFWLISAAYTIAFALFLIVKPPILSFLWRQTFWFKRPSLNNDQNLEAQYHPGYLKILFYFYQVVELLLITTPEDLIHEIGFISTVLGLFNFQIRSYNENVGCPFVGLTAVTKELFLSLKVFATMACTFVIFVIHTGISKTGRLQRPSTALYLAVAMEVLLLGYERLADASLSLLQCVPIGSEWRLFLDGNIHCWRWWQNMLIVYVAVFVAPFIMVLYFGSLRLYRNKVSVKEFLGACVLPLPFLVRWAVQHVKKSNTIETDSSDGDEIKTILHESFRPPTEEDTGTLYWESVLIGRRFILLCLHSFIADPMVRLLCLDCACVLILVHHIIKKPYRDVKANTCETVSLLALVVIATFSVGEAAFMSAGVEAAGPNKESFQVLQIVEVVLLGFLPAVFCVLLMFALLSQLCHLVVLLIRGFKKLLHNMHAICDRSGLATNEEQRPLLDPTTDD